MGPTLKAHVVTRGSSHVLKEEIDANVKIIIIGFGENQTDQEPIECHGYVPQELLLISLQLKIWSIVHSLYKAMSHRWR